MSEGASPSRPIVGPGTKLNGIYEIERLIAVGGMGEIYRGRAIQTGDTVAIKTIRPDLATNESALALFRKEAAALYNLHNEAIVRYFVFSIDPGLGIPYMAMEYVDGVPLSDLLKSGPLGYDTACTLIRRVAQGLQAAHELGIVHRDISPDNIILPGGNAGRAKIIDFGIARSTMPGDATVIGGGFAGKVNYVSPEQLGLFGGDVKGSSDIYSFGLVLAFALTGKVIDMGGSQVQMIEKRRAVPDLSKLDSRLRPLVEKMLQPDPARRIASMADVANAVPGPVRPGGATIVAPRARSRAPLLVGIGAGVVALAGAAVLVVPKLVGTPSAPTDAPPPDLTEVQPARPAGTTQVAGNPAPELTPAPAPASPAPVASAPAPSVTTPPATARVDNPAPVQPTTPSAPATTTAQRPAPSAPAPSAPATVSSPPPAAPAPVIQPPPAAPAPTVQTPSTQAPQLSSPAPTVTAPPPATTQPTRPSPPASGNTVVATLPPVQTMPPPTQPSPAERILHYIRNYEGGDCFLLTPLEVTPNKARVEAMGYTPAPFEAFDTAFKAANGFEADIVLRLITEAQCPAVSFLRRLSTPLGDGPRLAIGAFNLKDGETFTASVEDIGSKAVDVLLVSDDGYVYNLAEYGRKEASRYNVAMKLRRPAVQSPQPQLVLSIATPKPIPLLQTRAPLPADQLFPLLAGEARTLGPAFEVAVKYFRLSR